MSEIFTSTNIINIAIVFLAAILHACLQLGLACATLLYHESATKHITKKTKRLISSFFSGIGIMIILLIGATCFVTDRILGTNLSPELLCIVCGILIATSVVMFFLYYRRSGTELWLPKSVAHFVTHRTSVTDNNTEAFSLGILCALAELPLVIAPLIIATSSILASPPGPQLLLVAIYAIIAIAPLIVFRFSVHTGRTAIDIQKWRLRNKTFLRTISAVAFLALAVFIITFRLLA